MACAPEIAQDPPPAEAIFVKFDPGATTPVVPTPNDLAKDEKTGRIVAPSNESMPLAQREFNVDYLGNLDGFPFESTAEVLVSGSIVADSVNADTVIVLDLTDNAKPV